jgi:hypothetical protein
MHACMGLVWHMAARLRIMLVNNRAQTVVCGKATCGTAHATSYHHRTTWLCVYTQITLLVLAACCEPGESRLGWGA